MFGWGIHVIQNGPTLIFNAPMHWLAVLIGSICWIFIPPLFRGGHPIRNLLIGLAIFALYGILLDSSNLTLDRTTQTATIRTFFFFHWSTHTYPLKDISGVILHTGNTTSRMDLQFTDGSIKPITSQDQFVGKEKAMTQINNFLATP